MTVASSAIRGVSLRARVTSWFVGLLAVTLLVFSCGIYLGMRTYLKRSVQHSLAGTARSIDSNFLTYLPDKGSAWAFGEIRESYPAADMDHGIRISSGGRVLYESGTLDEQSSSLQAIPIATTQRPEGEFHRYDRGPLALLLYAQPFTVKGGQTFEVEVGESLSIIFETLHSLAELFLVTMPLILLAAAFGGYVMMRRPLHPLFLLTEKAEHIGRSQFGERLPVMPTNDELERLTHALNGMIERLEEALAHNYRFSADASHELRTPLTILRGELEEMLQIADLSQQAVDNVVSSLEEIDRMSHIVQSLMAITRLDVGGERMELQAVNLSALTRNTIEHMRLLAVEKGLSVIFEGPDEVWVHADPLRTKQVIVNLIDNAIKYTPPTPTADLRSNTSVEDDIRVTVFRTGSRAILEVSDRGIGIPEDSLSHVFERFFRADYARNRVLGGVGLGLAIVKSIVTAHDGFVTMSSALGCGSTVRVDLPRLDLTRRNELRPHPTIS